MGCFTRRSTRTVIDLSILSLTTLPVTVRATLTFSAISLTCLLIQHGFDASDILFHGAQKMVLIQLTSHLLHTQVELFLAQGQQLLIQVLGRLVTQITHFHHITVLVTNVVGTGSLAAASAKASRATSSETPSISYSTLPGWIWATQNSTLPLPLPIRTSRGF